MKKLIHVVRGTPERGTEFHLVDAQVHRHPHLIQSRKVDMEMDNFAKAGEFFLAEPRDADEVVRRLASENPGFEVRMYNLESVAQCPAAEMVVKKISESGVLPS